MGRVADLGCCICHRPAEVHHVRAGMLAAGMRPSHYDVIPLCPDHHRNGGPGVAVHMGRKSWAENYGAESDFLQAVKLALNCHE